MESSVDFRKITEDPSPYRHIERMPINEILININKEDQKVAGAVEKAIPQIERLVTVITDKMLSGGRLFYIGAGTSGRLAVVDASECPPTFGVPEGLVIAIIAGGSQAITQAIENAEDDTDQGWLDLQKYHINEKDVVVGIAASGTTPYVVSALEQCRKHQITTGCITNNPGSPLERTADFPIVVETGPEFITGSTRMKSGTAQKLTLNMISTTVMIQLGRVEDNQMVNMLLTNEKLVDRGVRIVMERLSIKDYEKAKALLLHWGSVKKAVEEGK
ncbi:N-acetylmuramic acid 6-phosphate etherase [Chitinophagaceae bacterium LB-8]|uniref:N-acetylmuramic acid 6-phosphate etherase n=1 Tax=Paraflavisolibacter caeni TaxID=2982496 RepID=A0A9X3B8V5_9BACT|nr:N-acetylmuramic acid 6-phosphate etherase [Paraflavisolibacter caeni]MCU7550251.1 N-acetylmuramic acid 6-phosphate etherase [Paraflavisolibacter caeni]